VASKRIYKLKSGEEIRWFGNHHGFVLVYAGRNEFDQRCYEIRKPTPEQRRGIVFSYIRSHEDEYVKVSFLSAKLGVTDRTIQSDLSYLERQGVIRRAPVIGVDGKQKPNRFETIPIKNGTTHMCTLENLYKPSNPAGFRTWSWDDYLMNEGKTSEELYEQYMDLLEERKKQAEKRAKSFRKRAQEAHKEDDCPEM
jgi:predicted AAA+ superfamily ATPase